MPEFFGFLRLKKINFLYLTQNYLPNRDLTVHVVIKPHIYTQVPVTQALGGGVCHIDAFPFYIYIYYYFVILN